MRFVIAAADEIGLGERKIVDVAGRSIGVFNIGGEFFALRNLCPHQAGALCEGTLWGVLRSDLPGEFEYEPSREILTCPWHGWEFHVRTGQSWCAPERLAVRSYKVAVVEGGEITTDSSIESPGEPQSDLPPAPGLVKGPYTAETYPVSQEGEYLVVDVPAA